MKPNTLALVLFALLIYFAATLGVKAVVPAPDGGYANFTTAEGTHALLNLTSGAANTGLGWFSLLTVATGSFNTGVGAGTLALNTADSNTASGTAALLLNTTGTENTANGTATLVNNSTGSFNSAFGAFALNNNTEGGGNTANGQRALNSNTTGSFNTANGQWALRTNTLGSSNTAIGASALLNNTTGTNNTALGTLAGVNVTTADHVICIGAGIGGQNTDNSCYIGNIFNASSSGGSAVFINANNRLGTVVSSQRFKEDIQHMGAASETLFALKPIRFHYKKEIDPTGKSQFGLVAEEVEKVNPDLVVRDKEGKPYSVRYDQVNAMLLNEFLKEHRTVEEQGAMIAKQQKQIEALTAGLQKVSDQLELSKPASQTAKNTD